MKIGVFDSGKGGTVILDEIKKVLPDEEYRYVADSEDCPYGDKSYAKLIRITSDIVDDLRNWGAKIIVIACNTATTKCIKKLRKMYPDLQFVGTEPAVRLAAKSDAKKVLVMATPGTIKSERLTMLLKENKKEGQDISLLSCPRLAETIEAGGDVNKILTKLLKGQDNYDLVVLGCTHYFLIKDDIQKFFPNAELIDGNEGVARRVAELVLKSKKDLIV